MGLNNSHKKSVAISNYTGIASFLIKASLSHAKDPYRGGKCARKESAKHMAGTEERVGLHCMV